jgi:hypothetical protein
MMYRNLVFDSVAGSSILEVVKNNNRGLGMFQNVYALGSRLVIYSCMENHSNAGGLVAKAWSLINQNEIERSN